MALYPLCASYLPKPESPTSQNSCTLDISTLLYEMRVCLLTCQSRGHQGVHGPTEIQATMKQALQLLMVEERVMEELL